ncbi:MAG TPA: hypothetical protein VH913_04165 [Hyphomicrobiaceae bacterium]
MKSLDELKGLKMRFFGLGAQVMAKLGVSVQLLAAADIYPALERGVIDATEFSMPKMDINLGFHQIAKFNYFPGWHQQVSCGHLLMNKKAWDALPDQYKAMIEVAGAVRCHGRDARQAQGVGERPSLQEDCRSLPRLPAAVCRLGHRTRREIAGCRRSSSRIASG